MEDIKWICSLESYQFFISICSIRNRSRKWDIDEKPVYTYLWRISFSVRILLLFRGDNPKRHIAEDIDGERGTVDHPQIIQITNYFLKIERNLQWYVMIETWLNIYHLSVIITIIWTRIEAISVFLIRSLYRWVAIKLLQFFENTSFSRTNSTIL